MSGIMVMSCAPQQKKLVYPETAKVDTVDVYFGTQVPDPYRWLENDTSAATTAWALTNVYCRKVRKHIRLTDRNIFRNVTAIAMSSTMIIKTDMKLPA